MADLSRQSSRQTLPETDSPNSFPDLSSVSSLSRDNASTNGTLHGLLGGDGPSMFDEASATDASSPQALSAASTPMLRNIIDHHGAINLVRRFSTLLAERDAHITALTRLAEEYKIPRERIIDAASRAKQAEQRRFSLATAVSEDLVPSGIGSDSSESQIADTMPPPTSKSITNLFGGNRRKSVKPQPVVMAVQSDSASERAPASSRSTSRPTRPAERPRSIDVQSVKSAEGNWTTSIFGSSFPKRLDSRNNRAPVEMVTRHEKDQLPPTLSNQFEDPQEAEWNKFLVGCVESRTLNGEDVTDGGMIGASRWGQDGSEGRKKLDYLTKLLVGGVPMRLRHPIWMELSNTQDMVQPNKYGYYLSLREDFDQTDIDAILKDVARTLTTKYDFYSGKGYKRLKEVLVAFVGRYPDLGYTQGLNTIAGYLLLAIPEPEDAFWVLCNIVENFFPQNYFRRSDNMTSPLADNILLREYVKDHMPKIYAHMDKLNVPPENTVPIKWFFTAFSSALPETMLFRIWDVWLCLQNQKHFLFSFALALLHCNADDILACEDDGAYFSYLDNKVKIPEDEKLTEVIKAAYKIGKKLDGIAERRAEVKDSMKLETKLRRRRTQSLEVLVDPDDNQQVG